MAPLGRILPGVRPGRPEPQRCGGPRQRLVDAGVGQRVESAGDRRAAGQGGGNKVAGERAIHPLLEAPAPSEDPAARGHSRRPRGHTDEGAHPPRPASRVELPGRGTQRERRHDPDEGKGREDACGHEWAGGGNATRFLERLRVVYRTADRVEDVSKRGTKSVAESAGKRNGCGACAGCGRTRRPFYSAQGVPARRRPRPLVEDGRVGILHADAPSRIDARQCETPGKGGGGSRAQAGRDLGDEEGEFTRGGRALRAASVARGFFRPGE